MPNRILRDWTDSERVNALSANAERFFVRLIMKADDYGRYYGSPQLLRSYLFPLRDDVRVADITRWIAECVTAGLVVDYEVAGRRYIEIPNFGQRLRVKMPSKFPPRGGECPSHDGHAAVTCPLETETEARNEKQNTLTSTSTVNRDETPAADDADAEVGGILTSCKVFSGYPKDAAAVIELAAKAGEICTEEIAEAYLLNRSSTGWVKSGGRPVRNVAADLKGFILTWRQNRRDDEKRAAGKPEIDRAGRAARKKRAAELEKECEKWE